MSLISAIICTHNPREDYLRRTLEALKAQTLPMKDWELILVDNASNEPLAGRIDLSWHPHARHVREEKTGLTHARLRGITEAKGDLLVFVDDDNVLRADYLEATLKIAADYALLGAWGGSCIAEYEVEPPAELRPWLYGLVVEKLKVSQWAKLKTGNRALPSGAGMTIRRAVGLFYQEKVTHDPMRQALDRSGQKLGAGGDSDMALCGFELGLGTGRFPELELTHLIAAKRLTLEYFEGLFEGFGYGGIILVAIHDRERLEDYRITAMKIFLTRIFMFATGKSRVERRMALAEVRGRLQAYRDLEQIGQKNG